jgi:long-chain-fatty-acid--CoA ligase ACSBG
MPSIIGITVHFAQPDAMKGSLGASIAETKPTVFFGVPRVWEKMEEKIIQMSKSGGSIL